LTLVTSYRELVWLAASVLWVVIESLTVYFPFVQWPPPVVIRVHSASISAQHKSAEQTARTVAHPNNHMNIGERFLFTSLHLPSLASFDKGHSPFHDIFPYL